MSKAVYVRASQGRNRPVGRSARGGRRGRAQSLSRSPNRLIVAPANSRQTRDDSGMGRSLPARLKLKVHEASSSRRGSRRQADRPEALSDDDAVVNDKGADPEFFSKTFFKLLFLGATQVKSSEPSVLELNALVAEIRQRAVVYRERGVTLPRYTMHINAKNVALLETQTRDVQQIPVNQVHFVAADPRAPSVFSLVARGRGGRFLCHVFECSSYRQCDIITKAVSEAFRIGYEKWLRVEENQRRLEERRSREMDMGGLEYFQEWDEHAPRGMPLYNISSYYNSGTSRPRQYLGPRDEMPRLPEHLPERLPERLVVSSRSNQGGEPEPYSMRYNFDDDEYDEYDDSPQEEVYVRQQGGGRRGNGGGGNSGGNGGGNGGGRRDRDRGRQPQLVFDVSPEWE